VRPGLRILFVGINPGLRSAQVGHHFAGYSNRFWKLLYDARLAPHPLTYHDDWRLPEFGLGLTNIIARPTAGIDQLTSEDFQRGRSRLMAKIRRYRPRLIALLGVTIHHVLFPYAQRHRPVRIGRRARQLDGIPVVTLPNPSGRNAHYSYGAMVAAFRALRRIAFPFPPRRRKLATMPTRSSSRLGRK
jgi:TDG/mug DNA glycosylase family protein